MVVGGSLVAFPRGLYLVGTGEEGDDVKEIFGSSFVNVEWGSGG